MMTKDEALIEEAMDVANEIDVAIAFKREWEAIDIIPSLLRKLAEALKQAPLNLNCKSVQKRLATQWGYVEQPTQDFFERGKEIAKWADKQNEQPAQEVECSNHPDAPHGFCRNASHSAGRYVCECEGWEAEQPAQEPIHNCPNCNSLFTKEIYSTPAQEPVAWGNPTYNYAVHHKVAPSWQGLSDDEKLAIIRKWKDAHTMREQELIGLGDAIEQALKEKNHECV